MQQLFLFLIRHSSVFLYLLYAIISLGLLFGSNSYHRNAYLSSSNVVVGEIYAAVGQVKAYFGMAEINRELYARNAELENKITNLQATINELKIQLDTTRLPFINTDTTAFDYILAQVVNSSISRNQNYITINKGRAEGIREEMGVVDHNGIIGIVERVSDHFAVVLPILNTKLRISCKVLGSDYFGSLVWDGVDPQIAILEELPRHVDFVANDTIVTSGYSAVFPAGLMVGQILEQQKAKNDNFYSLKIKLASDFTRLNSVRVILNNKQQEQHQLESRILQND